MPIRPERYAIVPLVIRATRSNFPSEGEKRKLRRMRRLPGPMEREESSRRMTPIDPSGPVPGCPRPGVSIQGRPGASFPRG